MCSRISVAGFMVLIQNRSYQTYLSFTVIALGLVTAGTIFALSATAASNPFDITFPIPELGNCESVDQCKVYCDDSANAEKCFAFAEKNSLMSKTEIKQARKITTEAGPGGCRGRECQTYCDDSANQEECFDFAAKNGFIKEEEAKKVIEHRAKIKQIETGPGGCKGEQECRTYCDDSDNLDECLDFSTANGFMSPEETSRIKRLAGQGPGGCKGEQECRKYCDDPAKEEECFAFAEKNGLIPKEELERAKKMIGKTGPGGCRGRECKDFCSDPNNEEECLAFAEDNGLIPKEELAMAKKMIGKTGPGGCRGKQCKDYCEDPANQEACFEFAKREGLIPPEELEMAERGLKLQRQVEAEGGPGGCRDENSCRKFCSDPANTETCLNFAVEKGAFSPEEAKKSLEQFKQFKEYGNQLRQRPEEFEGAEFNPEQFEGFLESAREQGFGPPGEAGFGPPAGGFGPSGFGQPGGGFSPPGFGQSAGGFGGGMPGFGKGFDSQAGGFGGPGGCSSPTECANYCSDQSNRNECTQVFMRGNANAIRPGRINEFRQPQFREGGSFEEGRKASPDQMPSEFPGGQTKEFPGQVPQQFPGQSNQFPGMPNEFPAGPPDGEFQNQFGPPEGFDQFNQQEGEFGPPEMQQQTPQFSPPPSDQSAPPPPAPSSFNPPTQSLLGFILQPVLDIFR